MIPYPPRSAPDYSDSKRNGEGGFPHSEIVGSKLAHSSPTLIAACHVLLRLYMPRHPPNALTSRLRIHTINDRPALRLRRDRCGGKSQPDITSVSAALLPILRSGANAPRHRFKNPFTMSKTRGQTPRYSAVGLLRAGSDFLHWRCPAPLPRMSADLVEPIGIEPMTSSLQS